MVLTLKEKKIVLSVDVERWGNVDSYLDDG